MKNLSVDSLPVNWFDLALIVLLVVGILRGRKRGMSQEFLDVIKWLVVVAAASFLYQPAGQMLAQNKVFDLLGGYIIAYVGIMMVVLAIFVYVKRAFGGKLLGSDTFGRAEYPLGMLSGLIRFACMIIVALAVLNARYYNPAEVTAEIKFQNDNYGAQFFPTLHSVQAQVFQQSPCGKWIKGNLGMLLIKPTAPEKKELRPQRELP